MKTFCLLAAAALLAGCSAVPTPYGYAVFLGGKGAMESEMKENPPPPMIKP
jgi:hypothetical protein